jgi:CarD family transcriptional regulator
MSNFKVGDKVVHLSHGVGVVVGIEMRQFSSDKPPREFYIIHIEDNGDTKKVFVPCENSAQRLRKPLSGLGANLVFKYLDDKAPVDLGDCQTWNRRYREYMELIHTGETMNIAKVYKALLQLKTDHELSFGERKLLDQARTLLEQELNTELPV